MLGDKLINRMINIWLKTEFEGGRHGRRLEKIAQIEKDVAKNGPCGDAAKKK